MNAIKSKAPNLDPHVLELGLTAYVHAKEKGLNPNPILTIIDYSKPSAEKRLWVVDLNQEKVLFNTHVAHGKNTGSANATSFSNKPNSLKSSYGVFLTKETYTGHEGYSLRIEGMEPGLNDKVYQRNIVFHGANYVSETIAKTRGMLGRSWGCMAVSRNIIAPLINTIKSKTLIFAYYPDPNWLSSSAFLN